MQLNFQHLWIDFKISPIYNLYSFIQYSGINSNVVDNNNNIILYFKFNSINDYKTIIGIKCK